YYGHVSRDGGYVVLQYWYFYAMNDWRSTFGGVNDHEADWEQVTVFLAPRAAAPEPPDPPDPVPVWIACSAHDLAGEQVRRAWDDPDLERIGEHPVVYAGAGSHAGSFRPGEHVTTVSLPDRNALSRRLRAWAPAAADFGLPFLDYHRGDGAGIGAG